MIDDPCSGHFGVDPAVLRNAERARALQSIYDLDDVSSEIAFRLSERFQLTLEEAFRFVWSCIPP